MIEYDMAYKHLGLDVVDKKIVIELTIDNMMGKKTFSATSNFMFFDINETWGHACGVGETEQDALNMCIKEIHDYTNLDIDKNKIYEINLPKRLTYIYKTKTVILYVKVLDENYMLLTNKGIIQVPKKENLIKFVNNNAKKFSELSIEKCPKEYFENYKFNEIFANMTDKYYNK